MAIPLPECHLPTLMPSKNSSQPVMAVNTKPDLTAAKSTAPPLAVDLDGTLVKTDLLIESLLALLKQNPLYAFAALLWLWHGKAYLKHQIAQRTKLDVTVLPYHADLLTYLKAQHAQGRQIILATATNERIARQIAEHLQCFSAVFASDTTTNLKSQRKRTRLVSEFGERGFDYVGTDRFDLPIWHSALKAILVNPRRGIQTAAGEITQVERIFEDGTRRLSAYIRLLRPHQWLKNLLIFVPLLTSHRFYEVSLLGQGILAFLAFGLCASSVYVLNDLLDLSADRHHPRKRQRPFAVGAIPVGDGLLLIPLLLGVAFGLAALLPPAFAGVLALYYVLTLGYSFYFKQVVILDVLVLAGLYTVRIIAGSAAVAIWPSFWLLAFSQFLFLSLAMVKRYTELKGVMNDNQRFIKGRDYRVDDLALLASLGGASGYLAVLVLALYINSNQVRTLYNYPEVIWLLCPLLLYWISRIWLLTHRGMMHDDPVVFALEDRLSRFLFLAMLAILILAA